MVPSWYGVPVCRQKGSMHEVSRVLHTSEKRINERDIVGVESSSSHPFAVKSAADISDPAGRSFFL